MASLRLISDFELENKSHLGYKGKGHFMKLFGEWDIYINF